MVDIIEKLKENIIVYKKKQYYFISDVQEVTGINRSYLYLLIKKKKITCYDKEGIKLIDVDSFNNYLINRDKKKDNSIKKDIIKKIQSLDEKTLFEIDKLINKPKK